MISVLLVDDHPIVLQGVSHLLASESDIRVSGQLDDPQRVVDEVRRLAPDVVVLDLMMPSLNGIVLLSQVRMRSTHTRVVVLSVHADIAYAHEATRLGALGYVTKRDSVTCLVCAIREAATGRPYLSPQFSQDELDHFAARAGASALDSFALLTDRERQVLVLACEGDSSKEIAAKLNISPRTAEKHRANLYRKLEFRNQTDLVRYGIRRGLISIT